MKLSHSLLFCICGFFICNSLQSDTQIKKIKYEMSLAYTQASQNDWWSKIEPYNIYLGALPLKNKGHLDAISTLGVTRILSVVEDFELKEGWLNIPATKIDWEAKGILVEQIPAVDFLPLTSKEIQRGIDLLEKWLEEGQIVYVHCKAGRGRSVTVVIAYLMKSQMLSFEEAYEHVKNLRPHINLNDQQKQAILDFFEPNPNKSTEVLLKESVASPLYEGMYDYIKGAENYTEESLAVVLANMLDYAIDGYTPTKESLGALVEWMPKFEIESTLSRRNRYLREYEGEQEAATEAAIQRNHNTIRRFKLLAAGAVPFVGAPTSYSISLWYQLREICLIAAINGHDLHDPQVKNAIMSALVGGNLLKVPAQTVDFFAKAVIKKILIEMGFKATSSSVIPAHLIFNYFTVNSAKVSTHAKALFAGTHSIPIPKDAYTTN